MLIAGWDRRPRRGPTWAVPGLHVIYITFSVCFATDETKAGHKEEKLTSGDKEERAQLLEEIAAWEIRLVALALPEETSSLLEYDLTLQQARVFGFILAHSSVAIGSVAEALCIKPNVATGIVQRLVERGLVERREDPQDRRIRLLSVSERGQALVEELRRIVLAKSREYLDRLSDDQLRQLRDIFASMGGA